jgi:hypothetical protein
MSDLSERAREVVQAGRGTHLPTSADRERIAAALRARLGEAAFSGAAAVGSLYALKRWLWPGVSVVAIGAAGGAFLLASGSEPEAPPRSPAVVVAPPPVKDAPREQAPANELPEALPAAPRASVTPAPASSGAAVARRASDRLAEEVALLSRATSNLNAGRAGEALKALDEHQRKFPGGVLTEERRGARAHALCALGLRGEAEKELSRLARSSPGSPHLAQARKWCGSAEAK